MPLTIKKPVDPTAGKITVFGMGIEGTPHPGRHGNKGARLIEMANLGLPVPSGIILHADLCQTYLDAPADQKFHDFLRKRLAKFLDEGSLYSVRSSAKVSMPGALDTVLNVGLTPHNSKLFAAAGIPLYDCHRRLFEMYADVVLGAPREEFPENDGTDLYLNKLTTFVNEYGGVPKDPIEQITQAVFAVFRSWVSPTAVKFRKLEGIPDTLGTAVVIQEMVYGNREGGVTGVAHSRCPSTGAPGVTGNWLANAQGEDIVAGTHSANDINVADMEALGEVIVPLVCYLKTLEKHHQTVREVEFTYDGEQFWLLQDRAARLAAPAAFQAAYDMVVEGLIDVDEGLSRVTPEQFIAATVPHVETGDEVFRYGIPASPGVAAGVVMKDSAMAQAFVAAKGPDVPVVLVRPFTEMSDIDGMAVSAAVLTEEGTPTSHAAVVSRSMNLPCVVGAGDLSDLAEGTWVTVDGSTGAVWQGEKPITPGTATLPMQMMLEMGRDKLGAFIAMDRIGSFGEQVVQMGGKDPSWVVSEMTAVGEHAGEGVVLDLRGEDHVRLPEDAAVWGLFGAEKKPTGQPQVEALLEVAKFSTSGASVILPRSKSKPEFEAKLMALGYKIVEPANDLGDLLNAQGPVLVDEEFAHRIGGWERVKELNELLRDAGRPSRPGGVLTPGEVALLTFGKGK